jgi:tripartite-type tricarboxylate transporter receptor subunit TctC
MFNTLVSTLPHLKSGRVRVLATTSLERLAELPDVPTVTEALHLEDFDASSWTALYAPAGTPPEIVRRLSSEIDAALKRPAIASRLRALGALPMGGLPERLDRLQRAEQAKWARVIKAAGVKPD